MKQGDQNFQQLYFLNQNVPYFTGKYDDSTRNRKVNILGISLGLYKLQIPTSGREERRRSEAECWLTHKPEHTIHWLFPPAPSGRWGPQFPCLEPIGYFPTSPFYIQIVRIQSSSSGQTSHTQTAFTESKTNRCSSIALHKVFLL